jgi:hypothetical protein
VKLRLGGDVEAASDRDAEPPGWTLSRFSLPTITLDSAGSRTVTFRVHGKLAPERTRLSAVGTMDGKTYSNGYIPIEYEHITPERIYRPATVKISAIDAKVPANLRVAYVPGVGDNVEPTLVQLGIPVTIVQPSEIPTVDLSKFTHGCSWTESLSGSKELIDNNPYLLSYARTAARSSFNTVSSK